MSTLVNTSTGETQRFNAVDLGRSWLSVAVASVSDDSRPALHRTVFIEQFDAGVRLVATDSYILLHSWVANSDNHYEPEPGFDEQPTATAVAIDSHGRAKGFLAHAMKVAGDEGLEVSMDLGVVAVEDPSTPGFDGMEARWVVLEMPDTERLKLRIYDGDYPAWRNLSAGFKPKETSTIGLSPSIVGRLAKIGKLHEGAVLGWTWGGPNKVATLEIVGAEPPVRGLVMPCRWDVERNEPYVEPVKDDA